MTTLVTIISESYTSPPPFPTRHFRNHVAQNSPILHDSASWELRACAVWHFCKSTAVRMNRLAHIAYIAYFTNWYYVYCVFYRSSFWNIAGIGYFTNWLRLILRILRMFNNYSPKWRWIVVDICRAAKRRGKYPPLSPTLRWIIVLVYTTQAE